MATLTSRAIIGRFLQSEISAPIALMELLIHRRDTAAVQETLLETPDETGKLSELSSLLRTHELGCEHISTMLRSELDVPRATGDATLDRIRRQFDAAASIDAAAGVAFYSLGSNELLFEATAEVVRILDAWGTLEAHRCALEIGCGIGRIMLPLAARLSRVVGIDVSERMLAIAQSQLVGTSNTEVSHTSGRDLAGFAEGSFELAYAVDVFPYLAEVGPDLVLRHFEEVSRVLQDGGDFVLFNFAYGRTRSENERSVRQLGEACGLSVVRSDVAPFKVWNGVGYHLRK